MFTSVYNVFFIYFPPLSHISTHRYSHVTYELKNVDKGKKYNLSVSKIKELKFMYTTLHTFYNCLKIKIGL
jgi:hypothetical protein